MKANTLLQVTLFVLFVLAQDPAPDWGLFKLGPGNTLEALQLFDDAVVEYSGGAPSERVLDTSR